MERTLIIISGIITGIALGLFIDIIIRNKSKSSKYNAKVLKQKNELGKAKEWLFVSDNGLLCFDSKEVFATIDGLEEQEELYNANEQDQELKTIFYVPTKVFKKK